MGNCRIAWYRDVTLRKAVTVGETWRKCSLKQSGMFRHVKRLLDCSALCVAYCCRNIAVAITPWDKQIICRRGNWNLQLVFMRAMKCLASLYEVPHSWPRWKDWTGVHETGKETFMTTHSLLIPYKKNEDYHFDGTRLFSCAILGLFCFSG